MRRTELSKQQVRRELAKLPIDKKLRLLEQLRDEALPKHKERILTQGQYVNITDSPLAKMIQDTVDGHALERGSRIDAEGKKQIAVEVQTLFSNRTKALEMLISLFPDGIPVDLSFYERLENLYMRMGWGEESQRATGLFMTCAVDQLSEIKGEALLREIVKVGNPFFFQLLDSLKVLFSDRELRPEFAAELFPAIVKRIGNDLASGGFWKALESYCEEHTQSALYILQNLIGANDEQGISVAASILGVLRSMVLDEKKQVFFNNLENEFSNACAPAQRAIYNRSWLNTAWRGAMQKSQLEQLTKKMMGGSEEEKEQVFWIVCRSLLSRNISADCMAYGLDWLLQNVSPNITPVAKYHVVDFASQGNLERQEVSQKLILQVQPISSEHKGIWQRIEYFLVDLLKSSVNDFDQFCVRLGERNANAWLEVMKSPRAFEWLLQEMHGKEISAMVAQLVISKDADCRKLGLFFYDELDLLSLPEESLSAISATEIQIIFYELQRDQIQGRSVGRYLAMLIPFVERAGDGFREEFHQELRLQAKNYSACREEFEKKANQHPILQQILTETDHYFGALRNIHSSSINKISMSGFRRASRLQNRKLSEAVSKGAEEFSIFSSFFKNVQLLYGKSWSNFHDGKLGDKSELQLISTSYEMPRLEIIDPEGMALRRLHASAMIMELNRSSVFNSK